MLFKRKTKVRNIEAMIMLFRDPKDGSIRLVTSGEPKKVNILFEEGFPSLIGRLSLLLKLDKKINKDNMNYKEAEDYAKDKYPIGISKINKIQFKKDGTVLNIDFWM